MHGINVNKVAFCLHSSPPTGRKMGWDLRSSAIGRPLESDGSKQHVARQAARRGELGGVPTTMHARAQVFLLSVTAALVPTPVSNPMACRRLPLPFHRQCEPPCNARRDRFFHPLHDGETVCKRRITATIPRCRRLVFLLNGVALKGRVRRPTSNRGPGCSSSGGKTVRPWLARCVVLVAAMRGAVALGTATGEHSLAPLPNASHVHPLAISSTSSPAAGPTCATRDSTGRKESNRGGMIVKHPLRHYFLPWRGLFESGHHCCDDGSWHDIN